MRIKPGIALVVVLLLRGISYSNPSTMTLQMTVDTVHKGVAVLAGEIDLSLPGWSEPNVYSVFEGTATERQYDFTKVGQNWNVWATIGHFTIHDSNNVLKYEDFDIHVNGQHMVKGTIGGGHEAEIEPNPLVMECFQYHLIEFNTKDTLAQLEDSVPHLAGTHKDTMTLAVSDLNGNLPGVLLTWPDRYAMNFLYMKPPEAEPEKPTAANDSFNDLVALVEDYLPADDPRRQDADTLARGIWSGLHGYVTLSQTRTGMGWPPEDEFVQRLAHAWLGPPSTG